MRIQTAIQRGPVVLDGGLATTLAAAGHDLDTPLWSARLLREEPEAIVAVHEAFLDAGAEVLVTASYQASVEGFVAAGCTQAEARAAIARSVELARTAIAEWRRRTGSRAARWVAGSVGPYGAMLADGSEYTGAYDLSRDELVGVHAERIRLLATAGADLLAIETQPRSDEALVALELARAAGVDAWVSFTTGDGEVLPDGTAIANAAARAAAAGAVAVGDRWDGAAGWVPRDSAPVLPDADLVGGCCGTSPDDIAALVDRLDRPS